MFWKILSDSNVEYGVEEDRTGNRDHKATGERGAGRRDGLRDVETWNMLGMLVRDREV